ncbi:MAG TPA: DUF6152 family protein [Micropepsaceae bacterium]|jgi:hypothetical protein|nr:DUF6152 family protein [Micropepsaceae bacterium]
MNLKAMGIGVLLAASLAAPSFAHHSFAMFDAEKTITVSGTVKELEWTNPHAWLRVTLMDQATGKPAQWAFEMGPPAQQIRRGWKADSLKMGDKVTLRMHPLKDGSRGGQLVDATLPDGRTVGGAGAPAIQD